MPPSVPGTSANPSAVGRSVHGAHKIDHVVFVVQENRSFNNLFMGFPGANTASFGYDEKGNQIQLHAEDLYTAWDIDHGVQAFITVCDGTSQGRNCKMDGWNGEAACCNKIPKNFAYAYVRRKQIAPYWAMAKAYVLADNVLQSNLDGSFVAHQYVIAGQAGGTVDYPNGPWGCSAGPSIVVSTLNSDRTIGPSVPPCFDYKTLGDEADAAGVSWRFYSGAYDGDGGIWSSYQAIAHVFSGPDWSNVVNPPDQFLTDVANGQLANMTWITPTFVNSDHPALFGDTGPAWVSSVVNAIGESKFWNSTAIFVIWDDWGGWFDPVKPVYKDYDGLGFRIPMIVISPYAKQGYVSHVRYETSSVLRFVERNFGLAPLAASDARANDPRGDAFDFTQPPRPFTPFDGARPRGYRQHRPAQPPRIHPLVRGD